MSTAKIGTVALGTGGPQVGVQGFGCMGISEFYGDTDEAAARDTLEAALEAGVTLFDTADIYGSGANEEFLAPFVRAHRDEITLATKYSIVRKADDPHYRGISNDPAYIRQAVDASLRRLGTRRDRPVLHAPPGPGRAVRRVGRRDGGAGRRGQGQAPGPVRGDRRGAARGARGAPDRGPPVGVVGLQPGRGDHRGGRRRRARGGPGAVLAARPRLPDRVLRRRGQGPGRRRLPALPAALHRRQRQGKRRAAGTAPRDRRRARRHARPDRPGLGRAAPRGPPLGDRRPDPGHPQARPGPGEHRRQPDHAERRRSWNCWSRSPARWRATATRTCRTPRPPASSPARRAPGTPPGRLAHSRFPASRPVRRRPCPSCSRCRPRRTAPTRTGPALCG